MNNYHTKHTSCRDFSHCYQEGKLRGATHWKFCFKQNIH